MAANCTLRADVEDATAYIILRTLRLSADTGLRFTLPRHTPTAAIKGALSC